MGLTVNRQKAKKLTVNRQKRNIFYRQPSNDRPKINCQISQITWNDQDLNGVKLLISDRFNTCFEEKRLATELTSIG